MAATYTDDGAAAEGVDASPAERHQTAAAPALIAVAPVESTSTPHVPGKWSGAAKLTLMLGACIAFWLLVTALIVWLV